MNRFTLVVTAALAAVLLAGCGGGGGSSPSPLAGHWAGVWSATGGGTGSQNGTADILIKSDGSTSGTIHNNTFAIDGVVQGTTDSNGEIAYTCTYPGQETTLTGTLSINDSGHLVGTANGYFNNIFIGTATFDLTKQ